MLHFWQIGYGAMEEIDYLMRDRRQYKRVKMGTLFSYQVERPLSLRKVMGNDKEGNALMLDLSQGGIGCLGEYYMPQDVILFIKFILIYSILDENGEGKEKVKSIEAIGKTRYDILVGKNEHRLGISFTYINEEDKKIIANFTENCSN